MVQTPRLFTFVRAGCGGVPMATGVRLAETSKERRRGLLGHSNFNDLGGLWIVPCEAIHTFGMKLPIDVVFLDKSLRVVAVHTAMRPRRIALCLPAHSVLELPAGALQASGITSGDVLQAVREEVE
jgi:uncharacterized protein